MTRISTRNRNGGGSSDKVSDEHLVIDMVEKLKSQGMFDRIRKQCLEEATRIPQYKELLIKVDTLAKNFLDSCNWSENLAKIELREELRRNISADDTLSHGITEIVEKLVKARMPKEFDSLAQKVVYEGLGGNYESWRARRAQRDRDRSRTTSRGQLQSQSSAKSPITPKGLTEPLVNNFLFPPPRLFLPTSSSAPLQTSLPNTLSSTQTFLPAHLPNFPLPPMSMVYPSVPLASNVINTQSAADEDVSRSKPQASAQASSGDVEITVEETTQCDDEMEIESSHSQESDAQSKKVVADSVLCKHSQASPIYALPGSPLYSSEFGHTIQEEHSRDPSHHHLVWEGVKLDLDAISDENEDNCGVSDNASQNPNCRLSSRFQSSPVRDDPSLLSKMENAKRHVITSRNQSSRRHVLLSNGESCVEEPMRRQSPRIRSQSKCSSSSGSASSIPHPSRPQPQIRSSSREWSSFGDKTNSTSHNTSVIRLKYQREWQRSRARELNSGHPSHSSGRHQRRREDSYQRYENSLCDDDSVNRRGHTQMASNYGNSRRRHITSPDERQRSARNHSRSSYSYGKRGSRERDIRQAHGKHGELGEVSSTTNSSPFINSRSMTSHHIQKMSTNRPRPSRPDNSSFRSHAISPSHHQSEQGVNKLNRYHHGYSNSSDLYTNPNDARERVSMSSNRLGTEFSPKRRFESNIHSAYSLKNVHNRSSSPSGNSGSCQPAWHSSFRPSKSSPFLRASRSSSGSNSTESSSSSSNTSSLSSSAVKNRQPAKNHSHLSRKHHYDYYSRQCNRAEPTSKQRPVPLIAYEAARVPSGHRNMKPSSPNISQFIGQHRTHEASSRDDHKFRNRSSGIGRTCGTSQSRESSGHTRNAWQPISAAATSVTHTVAVVPTTAATLTSTSNTGNYFEAPPALPIDHDYLLGPATTAPANTGFSAWSGKWQAVSPSNPDDDAVRPPGTHTSSKAAHTQAKGYEKSVRTLHEAMERRHQIEARLKEIALTRQQLLGDQEDLTLCDAQDSLTSALSRSERLLSSEKPLFKR